MRAYTRVIANNNETRIPGRGRVIFIDAATAALLVTVRKDETGKGDGLSVGPVTMRARQKLNTVQVFDDVTLRNESGVANTVTVLIGEGDFDAPLSEVAIEGATALITVADVDLDNAAATTILAADASRKRAHIMALTTNAINARIGDNANVAAGRGAQLQPGMGITIEGNMEISGAREAAGVVVVSVTVEDRP